MDKEKQFNRMKKVIDLLRKEKDEALGGMKQVQKEVEKEFGCKNLKDIAKKKKKLAEQRKKSEKKVQKRWTAFEKQFGRLVKALEEGNPKIHRIARKCIEKSKAGKARSKKAKKRSR